MGDEIESEIGHSIDLGVISLMSWVTAGHGIESKIGHSIDLGVILLMSSVTAGNEIESSFQLRFPSRSPS